MGVIKIHKSSLSLMNSDNELRLDQKFHSFHNKNKWNVFNAKKGKLTSFREILTPHYKLFKFEDNIEYSGIPTGREYLNDYGDIISVKTITKENHPNRLKYKADEGCVLISSLRGAKSPALSFDYDISNYVFSNGFYIFKIQEDWNKKFILYLLRNKTIKYLLDNKIYRGIGISSYKENDFLKIQIPLLTKDKQAKLVEEIEPKEKELNRLKDQIKDSVTIINEVFAQELELDLNKFESLKAENKFSSNLKEFSNNIDCRFSFKFHNKAGQFIWDLLCSKTNKRIKDFISEPIVLGKSVSPKDYDDEGDYYYIAMSNIKTWAFEPEGCNTVSNAYSKSNMNKSVKKDDIILARSGEGTIGKVALIEDEDISAIHADFTQRIRLTNYNARLVYYYMRSDLFQYLVYTHKKGLGNNTNIFPSQVQEFPIPDWNKTKQTEIVTKIKTQIDAQKEIDKNIASKQAEISAIIEKAIQTK
jgi:type I restriction enzyme, S subunit